MSELAPGWTLRLEESAKNHWIGSCGDIVLVFAYEGSHDDVRHVNVGARLLERLARERGAPVKLLFVLPPHHGKPPDARVRAAFSQVSRRLDGMLGHAAVVVSGTGFGAAVQRAAIAGILAVLRPKIPIRIVGSVREGLARLLAADAPAFDPLLRLCETRAQGPEANAG